MSDLSLPLVTDLGAQALVLAAGYGLTLGLSGRIVTYFFPQPAKEEGEERESGAKAPAQPQGRFDSSVVIGKAENLITLTFVLAGAETGLALIVAAKSLVRKEKIQENAGYYLGGMLVNLTWGLMMGVILRLLVFGK